MTPGDRAPPLDARPQELEVHLPKLLRAGLLIAVLLMTVGLALFAANPPAAGGDYSLFGLGALIGSGDPRGVIGVGMLLLLLTPLARVVASLGYFARQKDALYVLLTAAVLFNLGLAVAVGAV